MWQKVVLVVARSPKARKFILGAVGFLIFMIILGSCSVFMIGYVIFGSGGSALGASTCTGGYIPDKDGVGPNQSVVKITYTVGRQKNASDRVMLAAFEAGLVESSFLMYANSSVPASLNFPHDAVGSDGLSVNQFQQQFGPGFSWNKTIEQAMDPRQAAISFFNVAIDVDKGFIGTAGQLAQEVQRSAFPDRYDEREAEAKALLAKTAAACSASTGSGGWTSPLPGFNDPTSNYGECSSLWENCHTGEDYSVPSGTQVHAASGGTVTRADWGGAYGNFIIIDHGNGTETWYAHNSQLLVQAGDTVKTGQVISLSGATGNVTGDHLHFEVRINGEHTSPNEFLANHGVNI